MVKLLYFNTETDRLWRTLNCTTKSSNCNSDDCSNQVRCSKNDFSDIVSANQEENNTNRVKGHGNNQSKMKNTTRNSDITIKLTYPTMKLISVIDNVDYSTFVPENQPPYSWSINTTFQNGGTNNILKLQQYPLSFSIQNLFASFIHSLFCANGVALSSLTKDKISALFSYKENAPIMETFSNQSKKAVSEINTNTIEINYEKIEYLMTLIFPSVSEIEKNTDDNRNSNVNEIKINSKSSSVNYRSQDFDKLVKDLGTDVGISGNTTELMSIYAKCSSSLPGIVSSSELWRRLLSELRARWEKGIEIPFNMIQKQYCNWNENEYNSDDNVCIDDDNSVINTDPKTSKVEEDSVNNNNIILDQESGNRGISGFLINHIKSTKHDISSNFIPLHDRLLWDDIMTEEVSIFKSNGCIIDSSLSELGQKIQTIGFNIAVKYVSNLYKLTGERVRKSIA